jgi:DNA polymerase-3 subunit beta
MKFIVSSTELLNRLQVINRVINAKNTLPILDHFLFELSGNELKITASDLETTLTTSMNLENASDDGIIAIPARLLTDTLKEFPVQPLNFDINLENNAILISTENGKYTIIGQNGNDFPQHPKVKEEKKFSITAPSEAILNGINKTIFAAAEDDLRQVMNGIFINFSPEALVFATSDSHRLIEYKRTDINAEDESSFVFPRKPASILKGLLSKESGNVIIEFDDKNVSFTLPTYNMICRLIEGVYPNYKAVIPTDNPYKLIIDRVAILNSLRRVSVFSNAASNLIKFDIKNNQLTVSAQDLDFSISAFENLNCQYDGDDMEIGFKAPFLIEMISNLSSSDILIEMSDPSRAGIIYPADKENENEHTLMLLMPMTVGVIE